MQMWKVCVIWWKENIIYIMEKAGSRHQNDERINYFVAFQMEILNWVDSLFQKE